MRRTSSVWPPLCLAIASASAASAELSLVMLDARAEGSLEQIVAGARGQIVIRLPQHNALVAELSPGSKGALARDTRINVVGSTPPTAQQFALLSEPAQAVVEAWSSSRLGLDRTLAAEPLDAAAVGEPLGQDGLIAPPWWQQRRPSGLIAAEEVLRANGSGWENTSEFLAGRVSVNLLLPESDGTRDPSKENWTSSLESQVLGESMAALDALRSLHPGTELQFTVHLLTGRTDRRLRTGYEPIARPADPYGAQGEELWATEILAKLGYPEGTRLSRSRQLADATRQVDGTDWAINLFVVNSAKDADGKFSDGRFAYSWIGGPHAVLTSDNASWGLVQFDRVVLHELHHLFFALDQYQSSGCDCTAASGYLGALNDNCENGCAQEPCVMRDNQLLVSSATQRQVGSYDTDRDGTPDLLSVAPEITIGADQNGSSCGPIIHLLGRANVVAYPNHNPSTITPARSITPHTIKQVQVRVDEGSWQNGLAFPVDEAFDQVSEEYTVALSLSLDRHRIETRAIDSRGNVSRSASWIVDATESAEPISASLMVQRAPGGIDLSWDPAPGAQSYRVRRATQPDQVAASPGVIDLAATRWEDHTAGTQFYLISSLDGCGREIR